MVELYYRLLLEEKLKQNNTKKQKKSWKAKFSFFKSKKNTNTNKQKPIQKDNTATTNTTVTDNDVLNQNVSIPGVTKKEDQPTNQTKKPNLFKKIFLSKIGIFAIGGVILAIIAYLSKPSHNISQKTPMQNIQMKQKNNLKKDKKQKKMPNQTQNKKTLSTISAKPKSSKNNSNHNNNIPIQDTNNSNMNKNQTFKNDSNLFFQKRCATITEKNTFSIGLMNNIYVNNSTYHIGDKISLPTLSDKPVIIDGYKYISPKIIAIKLRTLNDNKICNVPIDTFSNFNYQIYFYAIKLIDKKTNQSILLAPQQTAFFKTVFVTTKGNKEAIFNTPKGKFVLKENSK